jgi:pimeloyl-ACP methyl ester carboxylesterase
VSKKEEKVLTNKKKQVLFLHGYLADKRSFAFQLPYFERNFDVFALDFKGFGENKGMKAPYSLDDYISEMREYMYKNGIIRPHVIAHSFGGRVAIKSASYDNGLFDKIVLTGAAGLKPKRTVKKFFKRTAFNVLKKFVNKERLTAFYSKDYLALDDVMKESFKKIVSETLDDRLSFIRNSTLIVFGDKDKETPIYMAKRLNRGITDSKLIIIKGAGHFCFIDKYNKFNTEVKEFLLS